MGCDAKGSSQARTLTGVLKDGRARQSLQAIVSDDRKCRSPKESDPKDEDSPVSDEHSCLGNPQRAGGKPHVGILALLKMTERDAELTEETDVS
jgi:hypothetical protein